MLYMLGLTFLIIVAGITAFNPALIGVKTAANNGRVFHFVDEMVKISDIHSIKLYVGGWAKPEIKRTVNCCVVGEYLGPAKRGHYAM
jgi:hypothetical protein